MSEIVKPEVACVTACCPHPEQWSCYDSEGTELEVLSALQSLIVMLKPTTIIETGCYRGYGTEMLARGVAQNGFGSVLTTDIGGDMVQETQTRLTRLSLDHLVSVHHGTGLELIAKAPRPINFAFLDSGPDEIRCHELRAVLPKLAPSGIIAVHDTGLQHGLREYFVRTVNELGLMYFMFDTPRGFSLVRKTWGK